MGLKSPSKIKPTEEVIMSLEEALNRNTETLERLIVVLSQRGETSPAPTAKQEEVKVVEATPVAEPVATAEPVRAKPPRRTRTPKQDTQPESTAAQTVAQAESIFQDTPVGSAPVNNGSEWYRYTMQLCARYSAHTGDPAQTQAICHKHGVMDLSKADDYTLSQIALEIEPALGIVR